MGRPRAPQPGGKPARFRGLGRPSAAARAPRLGARAFPASPLPAYAVLSFNTLQASGNSLANPASEVTAARSNWQLTSLS